ncbi:MAG: aldehyde ferredoxin oxidoreductase family protein, partial [Anaerolineales bacterium]|nr:aldehyde ferredoxin oxidoreductase family protein [Anaerolineales bacterium]
MKGYMGKMLVVDLTKRQAEPQPIAEAWFEQYVGGEGVAMRLFNELVQPDKDVLDPVQPLIFATGPLTGTLAPCSGRCVVVFWSPPTKTIGASNGGGDFAPTLKRAGWDMLVVTGKADSPVYLVIDNDKVEIRDASMLWGKTVSETEDYLKENLGLSNLSVASIGIAGEKGVMFASIMNEKYRAFGRGGPGAVMGSKNLKAIAVRGTKRLPTADQAALKEVAKDAKEEMFLETFVREELRPYGTPSFYDAINALGILPTKNWQRTTFPESQDKLTYQAYHQILEVSPKACFNCAIHCGRYTKVKEGPYAGMEGGGPEYESIAAFGSKCLVTDLNAVAAANHLANDFGLDIISTGQVIATAMEWYEQGILNKEKTQGIDLTWGNGDAVVECVKRIAHREGIGDLLAQGVKRAAEALGPQAEYAAMHVKGLEMAADEVRASKGEAVVHATAARGADHLRPYASAIDAFGYRDEELGVVGEIDYLEDGNKAWIKPFQELSMATNLLGVCLFASITLAIKASTWAKLLSE